MQVQELQLHLRFHISSYAINLDTPGKLLAGPEYCTYVARFDIPAVVLLFSELTGCSTESPKKRKASSQLYSESRNLGA